jgi:imidazolonepropionase-like amidohydrolase
MLDYGMDDLRALRAATQDAANLLGLEDVGRIAPGAVADLCVFPPPKDGRVVPTIVAHKPSLVIQAGRVRVTAS